MPTHLCLDFGTAYSKAAVCEPGRAPFPLAIGQAARQAGDAHMVRTALFINSAGELFFGEAAEQAATSEDRSPFDTIKEILTNAEDPTVLEHELPAEHNPTCDKVNGRQALEFYLAFLTRAALRAPRAPDRDVRRSIATPVFPGPKAKWVSTLLADSLARSHVLADQLGDQLFGRIDLLHAIRLLPSEPLPLSPVVARPPTVAEPVAAIASQLLHFTPSSGNPPGLMMVVDVGAGTTDVAMFAAGQGDGDVTMRHVSRSKRSILAGGKAIDRALVANMVRKSVLGQSQKRLLRANLLRESQGQPMKEEIFRQEQVERFGITTTLREFLRSSEMGAVVAEIRGGINDMLLDIDRSFFARTVAVRFSGGGAFLPFLDQMVPPEQILRTGSMVRMGIADRKPMWHDEPVFRRLYNRVGDKFHRLSVALGGAYYGAEGRSWLKLEDDIEWLGASRDPDSLAQR